MASGDLLMRSPGWDRSDMPQEGGLSQRAAPKRPGIGAFPQEKYPNFGAALAARKPAEREEITAAVETVRQMPIALDFTRSKKRRHAPVFCSRQRRPRRGEWIQSAGGPHAWFEDCGPRCTLIVVIDAATGRLAAFTGAAGSASVAPSDDSGMDRCRLAVLVDRRLSAATRRAPPHVSLRGASDR